MQALDVGLIILLSTGVEVSSSLYKPQPKPFCCNDSAAARGLCGLRLRCWSSPFALIPVPIPDLNSNPVATRGVWLPPLAGFELAFYLDHCGQGFDCGLLWRDQWPGSRGSTVRVIGSDLGPIRLRLVLQS